jgi:crotonobetainyl-CoA:carnitine CoA-transferase CaiB-like acyl-CoA transferase
MSRSEPAFLRGVRVLELGDGVAGASATAILASLGADVTTITVPGSALRRARPALADGRSLLAVALDAGKTVADQRDRDDPSGFDVVVCDRVSGAPPNVPVSTPDYLAHVAARNPGVWVTITAVGLTGPNRDVAGTELTVAALGGLLSAVTDPSTGQPLKLAGPQALRSAGQIGALAACHGLDLRRHRPSVHLDVSAQEAVIATGPVLRVVHALLNCTGDAGARRYGAPAGFYPCADGVIRISAMENHQWEGLVRAFGTPAWAEPFTTTRSRTQHADEIDDRLAGLTSTMTKRACEDLLQAHGVPATAMNSPAELLASPHFEARHCWRHVPAGDGDVTIMGPPAPYADGRAARPAPSVASGLAGLRVVEAGHVLAVPLAGALLGAMGADVTKLEDPDRLDMYRRRGPYIDSTPGIERAAYFAFVNHSKRSRSVPLDEPPPGDVLDGCDVVIENYGPGRARRLGIDAAGLGQRRPQLLAVSSSGFGHTGPWSSYRAYAYNLQTACGLGYLTRTSDGSPAEIDMAWADLISGFAIATVVAAWAVGPAGRVGASLDFSMAEVITARFNEFLAAASCGVADHDQANEVFPYAPNGVYPTGDGWLALSVENDRGWQRTRTVLGHPEVLDDERFATAAGRFDGRDALDRAMAKVTAGHRASGLAAGLQAAGVAAAAVATPDTLIADAHLAARQFFATVEHPEWGERRLIGLPWRVVGAPPFALRPPPLLDAVDARVEGAPAGGRP